MLLFFLFWLSELVENYLQEIYKKWFKLFHSTVIKLTSFLCMLRLVFIFLRKFVKNVALSIYCHTTLLVSQAWTYAHGFTEKGPCFSYSDIVPIFLKWCKVSFLYLLVLCLVFFPLPWEKFICILFSSFWPDKNFI